MNKLKNIVFDWSGVVRDSLHDQLEVVNEIFVNFGVDKISLEEFRQNWRQPYMDFYIKYIPGINKEEQDKMYTKIALSRKHEDIGACEGMPELIRELKDKGFRMFVISSDIKETLYSDMKRYELEGVFEKIYSDVHDKAIILRELVTEEKLNLDETCIIGDSNHEIESGKNVGVKTIAVTWGFSTQELLSSKNPDFLATNAKELEKILLD